MLLFVVWLLTIPVMYGTISVLYAAGSTVLLEAFVFVPSLAATVNVTSAAATFSTALVSTVKLQPTVWPLSVLNSLSVIANVKPVAGCFTINPPVEVL